MKLKLADLLPGTHYVVQVRVANANEESAWSPAFDLITNEDTTAPKTPTNVTWVVVGDAFYGEWDSMGENVNNDYAVITRYELEFVGNSVTKIVSVPQITQSRNNYTLTFEENKSLFGTPAASVRLRVRSVDIKDLKSEWSTPITVSNPVPSPPTTPVATGSTGNIAVEWKASVSDDVIGYNVYVGTTAGFSPGPSNLKFSGDATSYIYSTSLTSTQYFKIRAVDKFNQESTDATANAAASSPFVVDTTPPPVPTALAGIITNNADGLGARVSLTWTMASPPSDLAGFYVRYRRVGDTNFSNAAFQKDDRAGIIELQKAYQNYEFQIKAYDWQNNESAWSSTVTVTSPANSAPANVAGLTGTAGRDSIVYKWNPVADLDVKNYEVTFSASSTFASGNITYLNGTSTTLTVSGLSPSTTYYARVRAVDTEGLNSAAWSSTVTVSTTAFPLSDGIAPSSSPTPNVSGGIGYIFAIWNAITNADPVTYEVHISTTSGFTPNSGTKVSEISGTSIVLEKDAAGANLAYGTTYYIKLIAKDRDGSAAAGAQGSGSPVKALIGDVTISPADIGAPSNAQFNAISAKVDTSIKSYVAEYAVNSSETVAPSSGWSTTTPTRTPGTFIWYRTTVTYNDNTTSTTSPALMTGNTGVQGSQGIPGNPGSDGTSLYTWLKYADTPTTGMSDLPTGKTYIGIAVNKTSSTESSTYSDYTWSLIKGEQGIPGNPGSDGQTTYTWVKYADNVSGGGMSDLPTGKPYIGLAFNKTTATESNTPGDYAWSLIQGPQGVPGENAANVYLTATTQALTSPAAGGATTPATSVVTGTAVNTTITAWTYSVDGAAFSATVPAGVSRSGNVVTITGSTMTAKTIAVRMADANGVADTLTVAKVFNGATGSTGNPGDDGLDAYTVILTNESQVFAGSATAALAGSTTSGVIAYKGATQIAATIGTITGQVTGLTTSISNNGTTTASITVTVTTSLTTKSGELTIPITVDGNSFTKKFSWSLSLTGATGSTGGTGVGIISVTPYFYQTAAAASAPAKPTASPPPSPWTTTEPAYANDTALWRTERILYTNSTFAYTDVTKVSSYAAAIAISDSKSTVIMSTGTPGSTPNKSGDTWFRVNGSNEIYGQWVGLGGTAWQPVTLRREVITDLDAGSIKAGFLSAARIDTNALSISQVNTLQSALDAKATTASVTNLSNDLSSLDSQFKSGENYSSNPFFDTPSGNIPSGYTGAAGITKTTTAGEFRTGTSAVKHVVTAGVNAYLTGGSVDDSLPNSEYITFSIDFKLISGDLGGSAVLIRWINTAPTNYDVITRISDFITPELNRWYRLTRTIKRPTGFTGTFSNIQVFPMAAWTSAGTITAKTIIFDRFDFWPATQEEISAYNSSGTFVTTAGSPTPPVSNNIGDTWYDQANNRTYRAVVAGASTIAPGGWVLVNDSVGAIRTLWGHPSDTTFIDGGDIYTNTVRANSIAISDWNNYNPDPNFENPSNWPSGTIVKPASERNYIEYTSTVVGNTHFYLVGLNYRGFSAEAGDKFRITAEVYGETTNTVGGFSVALTNITSSGASAWPSAQAYTTYTNVSGTWKTIDAVVTMPANTVGFGISPFISGSVTGQKYRVRNITIRRMNGGELIIDGSVQANKITAGIYTGGIFEIQTGGIIKVGTGGQIVTAGNEVIINSSGISISSAGNVDAGALTNNSTLSATGLIMTGNITLNSGSGYIRGGGYTGTTAASNPSGTGWFIGQGGLHIDSGEIIADAVRAGNLGGPAGVTSVINIAGNTTIITNGGAIRSNTYGGNTYNASATAGYFISDGNFHVVQGQIKANALVSDTLTSTTITLGSGGSIVGGSWTLNSSGLTIPDGVISASKLRLQTASNIAPFQFSSFPFPSTSYSFPAAGDSTTATVVGIDGSVIPYTGDQMLKISWGSLTAARAQHLLPTSTGAATADRSVDVRPNTTYIVSAWLYSPSACVDNELRLNAYGVNTTTNTINTGLYGVQGALRKVDDGSTGLAAGTWTRMRATILTNASVTRIVISPTNYQTGTPKVIYYSGIQVEEKITTGTDVESLKPSPYMIPGLTAVDGGMIKTGSIQSTSTTASQTWNGTTNTWVSSSQPTWSINTNGNATFWHAQVRGDLVVGNSGDPLTSQAIVRSQNWSYTNATTFTGWAIEGNGSAFFNNVTARGDIEATSINAIISPDSGGGIYARGEMGESVQLTGNGFNVFGAYEIKITHIQVTGGNTITVTTAGSHGFTTGNKVSLSGLSNANYNGTYGGSGGGSGIVSTPSATTFTVQKAGLTNVGNTAMSGIAKSLSNGSASSERALLVEFPTDGARPNIISGQLTTENLSVSGVSQFQGTMNLQNGFFMLSKGVSNPASAPTATATYSGITPQPRSWTELGGGLTKGSEGSWYSLDRNTSTNTIQIIRISSGLGTKTVMASASDADFIGYAGIVYSSANSRYYAGYIIRKPGQPRKLILLTYNTSFTLQDTKSITLPGDAGAYGKDAAIGWDHISNRLILVTDDFGPNARRVDYIALSSGIPSASLTTGMSLTGYITSSNSANPSFVTRINDSTFASGERIVVGNRNRLNPDPAPIFEAFNSSGAKLANESWASPGTYLVGVHFDSSTKIFSARAADSYTGTNEKIIDFENGNSWWTNNTSLYQTISAKYTNYKRIATKTATITNRVATTTQITLTTSSSSFNASDNGKWVEVTGLGVRFNGVWKIVGNPTSTSIVLDSPGTSVTAAAATGQVALDVYETAASPETTAPVAKRAKVYVSVPAIPKTSAVKSPDKARVYVYTTGGGSNPAMSLISHPGTAIVSTLGPSATNDIVTPPAMNAFADINSPSFIANTDATSYWSGTGEALFTGVSVTGAVNAWAVNTTEDTGWNNITTFYNSWVNFDGRKAQYKRLGKQVWLRGVIKSGSLADALLIPTGFRPANTSDTGQRLWICASGGGTPALVTIMPSNGILSVQTGSNSWLSLDNITYLTV